MLTRVFRLATAALIVLAAFQTAAYGVSQEQEIGIDEKLGQAVPLDLSFNDEQGRKVALKELVTKPTVLSLVYFQCTHTCPALLAGLANVVSRTDAVPGKDYNILSISFDQTDTPAVALDKKRNYLKAMTRKIPEESWRFLTGSEENIQKITEAVGFKYKKAPVGFAHPVALIVLSPEGKITRYLYGITFLPMDLSLAVSEASKGLAAPTVNKLLLYCYSYDPVGKRYVFDILKVTGAATLIFIILFIGWLTFYGKKRSPRQE